MVIVKRITVVLWGLAIAGILIMSCEKMDGPPPYLAQPLENNQIELISTADQGEVPLGPIIPLDSLKQLIITDSTVQAIVNIPEYAAGLPIDKVGKIVLR